MADKQEIEILITPEGEVRLDVKGMQGEACLLEIGPLIQALGTVKQRTLKPEYYAKTKPAATTRTRKTT